MPFTITPTDCTVTYACDIVTRVDTAATPLACSDFSVDSKLLGGVDDGKISIMITADDYKNDVFKPGDFLVKICATVDSSTTDVGACANVPFKLIDPCDPPSSLSRVGLTNQIY